MERTGFGPATTSMLALKSSQEIVCILYRPSLRLLAPARRWLDRATSLDYVAPTLPGKERYLAHVAKYAEGKARSKVGNAVRRGVAAHDYDDDKDG